MSTALVIVDELTVCTQHERLNTGQLIEIFKLKEA